MKFRVNYGICLIIGLVAALSLVPLAAKFDFKHRTRMTAVSFQQ